MNAAPFLAFGIESSLIASGHGTCAQLWARRPQRILAEHLQVRFAGSDVLSCHGAQPKARDLSDLDLAPLFSTMPVYPAAEGQDEDGNRGWGSPVEFFCQLSTGLLADVAVRSISDTPPHARRQKKQRQQPHFDL